MVTSRLNFFSTNFTRGGKKSSFLQEREKEMLSYIQNKDVIFTL
jgi:hypothetical protein